MSTLGTFIQILIYKPLKEFVKELRIRIEDDLDADWQESSKRDAFIKDIKQTLQEMILKDYKE